MVLSSLRRLLPPSTFDDVNDWMGELKRNVRLLLEDGNGMNAHNNDKRRVKEEEQWTLEKKDDDHTIKIISHYQQKDNDDSVHGINLRKQLLHRISTIVQQLKILATSSIPEIISRITHATSPILHELSRGYFVPFLTIALACLGRIHNLLLIMGREVVSALQETVPQLRELCQQKGALGISSSDTNSIVDWKELENIVMPTFVGKRQHNNNNNNNVNTKTDNNCASQEWNDLMTQFVEVSHEELTKQTNDFIKGKRWNDAMFRLGLRKCHEPGTSSTAEQIDKQNDDEEMHSSSVGVNDTDMGELVNMQSESTTHQMNKVASRNDAVVDDNMARILQKVQSPDTLLASKKKRKKRKRTKRNSSDGFNSDDALDEQQKQQQPQQHVTSSKSIGVRTESTGVKDSSSDVNLHQWNVEDESLEKRKQSEHSDINVGSTDAAQTDFVSGMQDNTKESREIMKEKKSKKKSSKKKAKKEKKKSTSVIDDIFGF